jgi:glutathione-regulated potassium-efflux system protein KefB
VGASLTAARLVREHFPQLPIYARARNRNYVHQLMNLGVKVIRRETFASALELSRDLLRGLGLSEREVRFTVETFARHDRQLLKENYKYYTDQQKMMELARSDADTLAQLFAEDRAAEAEGKDDEEAGRQPARKSARV